MVVCQFSDDKSGIWSKFIEDLRMCQCSRGYYESTPSACDLICDCPSFPCDRCKCVNDDYAGPTCQDKVCYDRTSDRLMCHRAGRLRIDCGKNLIRNRTKESYDECRKTRGYRRSVNLTESIAANKSNAFGAFHRFKTASTTPGGLENGSGRSESTALFAGAIAIITIGAIATLALLIVVCCMILQSERRPPPVVSEKKMRLGRLKYLSTVSPERQSAIPTPSPRPQSDLPVVRADLNSASGQTLSTSEESRTADSETVPPLSHAQVESKVPTAFSVHMQPKRSTVSSVDDNVARVIVSRQI